MDSKVHLVFLVEVDPVVLARLEGLVIKVVACCLWVMAFVLSLAFGFDLSRLLFGILIFIAFQSMTFDFVKR